MTPLEEIKIHQDALKQKIKEAIEHFEEKTGVQIYSVGTITRRENSKRETLIFREIEITYQELK